MRIDDEPIISFYELHKHEDPDFPIYFHFNHVVAPNTIAFHWHESYEFLFFLSGEGTILSNGVPIHAVPGDLAVINSNHLHTIQAATSECNYHCLIVDKTLCDSFLGSTDNLQFSDLVTDIQVADYFKQIETEWSARAPYYKQRVKLLSLSLVLYLIRNYALPKNAIAQTAPRHLDLVKDAIRYMQVNFREPLTVEMIAAQTGFSKYYFCRTFKDVTGYSTIEYLNFRRLEHARKLLKSGKYNVGQSAAESGFANLSYFTRAYKRQYGYLPSEEG